MIYSTAGIKRDKNALIIHSDGNLFNNPTLKCIVDMMLGRGYEIDFRYPRSEAPMPKVSGLNYLPFEASLWRIKSILYNKLVFYPIVFCLVALEKIFLYKRYDLIIAVDRQALIEASVLHALTRTPYILISFEIMFASETSRRIKEIERRSSKNLQLWLIQDEERAHCLQEENGLDPDKCMLLPLASLGPGIFAESRLRDELKIPAEKKVAILMGSIVEWSMTEEVLSNVANWPEDWVLILHDRYGRTLQRLTKIFQNDELLVDKKIFISNSASELVDDMGYILAGVDVGLAFYRPVYEGPYLGKNLIHLGLASGKISTCLRYGVPVITNEIGLYAKKIRELKLGEVIFTPEQLSTCLVSFRSEQYRVNAKNYFMKELDFGLYAECLWEKFELIRKESKAEVD